MSRRAKRVPSILEVACRNVGWRFAAVALVHAFQWAITREALGRDEFTIDELSEWWGMSRAQGFREQSVFRRAVGHMCHGQQAEFAAYIDSQSGGEYSENARKAARALARVDAAQREQRQSWEAVAAAVGVLPAT